MFDEVEAPLIRGLHTPYGLLGGDDRKEIEGITSDLDEMQEEYGFTNEFKQFLGEHCFAMESCHGSIYADPRVLFRYLWLAWMMNEGDDLRKLVASFDEYARKQYGSSESSAKNS
jgi:hypothetical protein